MQFYNFVNRIPKIAKESLPGESAHFKMAPPERKVTMASIDLSNTNPKKAAVMMLVYPRNGIANLALILRNSYSGVHSSQVAFPGGKFELTDPSYEYTALRETHEEIGIHPTQITVIMPFTPLYIPPSNFMVWPFLGYCDTDPVFIPDPAEVAGMIEYPLSDFLDDRLEVTKRMATSYSDSVDVPAYAVDDHYVWGATAMMLSELKQVLKRVS